MEQDQRFFRIQDGKKKTVFNRFRTERDLPAATRLTSIGPHTPMLKSNPALPDSNPLNSPTTHVLVAQTILSDHRPLLDHHSPQYDSVRVPSLFSDGVDISEILR